MKNIISLKNYRDFGRVYNQRKSFADKYLVMYAADNLAACSRIGISVSKKVGNSVVRHRITCLIRESYRLHKDELIPGIDIVVVARSSVKGKAYRDVESSFLQLCRRHHILKNDFNMNDIHEPVAAGSYAYATHAPVPCRSALVQLPHAKDGVGRESAVSTVGLCRRTSHGSKQQQCSHPTNFLSSEHIRQPLKPNPSILNCKLQRWNFSSVLQNNLHPRP